MFWGTISCCDRNWYMIILRVIIAACKKAFLMMGQGLK